MATKNDSTVSRAVSARERKTARQARLRSVYPAEIGVSTTLDRTAIDLGRSVDAPGITLDSATVSRAHARISWSPEDDAHVLRDLGSRNGSSHNGVALDPAVAVALRDGDVVRLGDVILVYETGSALGAADSPLVDRAAVPGDAASMVLLRGLLARAAIDRAPVLIVGPTGVGKELIAHEIHRLSRRKGELVIVNCAALSEGLIESQLFGHVRGAFTGATEAQPGLFRAAQGGTLFLDEIGELPADLQPKLLRAIELGEIQPVGATKSISVDVRVVGATHRSLAEAVEVGQFRRDLYARLSLWELRVPALTERRADVLAWLAALWRRRHGEATPLEIDCDFAHAVALAPWPTNLRGIDRLVHELDPTARHGRAFSVTDLPAWLTEAPSPTTGAAPAQKPSSARATAIQRKPIPSRDEFVAAFEAHKGSVRGLARFYGRDRRQIYRWIEQHGLRAAAEPEDE